MYNTCKIIITIILIILFVHFYIGYNTNYCIERNFCLTNKSLYYKRIIPYSCNIINSLNIPFHVNRKLNNHPNFIVTTIFLYPSKNKYNQYINFIKSFSVSNKGSILLFISVNISLYELLISSKYITEISNKNKILLYLHQLDKGYRFFKFRNNNTYCYIIYTNIEQNYYSNVFLKDVHYTMNKRRFPFTGYYAAATNLYSVIPYMLQIFDYFDYYFKYDFDQPAIINIKEFAFGNIKINKWYVFGTCLNLDSSFVCTNIKK